MIATWILHTVLLSFCVASPGISDDHPSQARLSQEVDLSLWGIGRIEDIGFVSIGIMHGIEQDQMVVYHIRRGRPVPKEPDRPWGAIPKYAGDSFLVADFGEGNVNRLGGYFNSFSKAPSKADVTISLLPAGEQALAFAFTQDPSGFAGFWVHLFDFKSPPAQRIFLDSSPFAFITFSIRGEQGSESLRLQIADRIWEQKEDSLPIDALEVFLPEGRITTEWQRAWVPLTSLPARIDPKELASLVFAAQRGRGRIYLRDISFTKTREAPTLLSKTPPEPRPPEGLGMWLWETAKLLGDHRAQTELQVFCRDQGITDLFLQLPYRTEKAGEEWKISWDQPGLRELLKGLHAVGITCHALDGDPRFALEEFHDQVKATLGEIIRYNRGSEPEARFDAVRYDIEPYILPSFAGANKEKILRQYLALLKELKRDSAAAGLALGADIPFWFDALDRFYEPITQLDGRPFTEALLAIADNIGIMDYRTRAYGADGTIAHAMNEIRLAEKMGKKIFIGLETVPLPEETILDFEGDEGPSRLGVRSLEGNRALLHWIPGGSDPPSGEALGPELFQIGRTEVPSTKITFQEKTWKDLEAVMRKTAREFGRYRSFYGFAIHSYESFRPWLGRNKGN